MGTVAGGRVVSPAKYGHSGRGSASNPSMAHPTLIWQGCTCRDGAPHDGGMRPNYGMRSAMGASTQSGCAPPPKHCAD
eukprot:1204096-Prymnesium_polylepis.1